MSGHFTTSDSAASLSQQACQLAVCRYNGTQFKLIPNVVCERIEREIGAKTSTAHFRYLLDTSGQFPDWPSQFEDIWPQTANSGPYVLSVDDRVVVIAWTPDGQKRFLFDGFAQIPQVNVDQGSQQVTVTATGVECRCWDVPIISRMQRDIDDPKMTGSGKEMEVELPCRFNPSHGKDGLIPNCTPKDYDTDVGTSTAHPVFLDETIRRSANPDDPNPDPRTFWTVAKAVRYLFQVENKPNDDNDLWVVTPDADTVATWIDTRPYSIDSKGNVIWETTKTDSAPVRDLDLTNKTWPDAAEHLLRSCGLGCYFQIVNVAGQPSTYLRMYRLNDWTTTKTVSMAPYGAWLDQSDSNVSSLQLARDVNRIVNSWAIETPVRKKEVSIVLAPGFTPNGADVTNTKTYLKSQLNASNASAATRAKYRKYVANEDGSGYWDGSTFQTDSSKVLDLKKVFPDDKQGNRSYIHRARPGTGTLLSKDGAGKNRKAVLCWSTDYAGDSPAIWDGTGSWKPLAEGEWALLKDQLGIELTVEDPEKISTGDRYKHLRGITQQAAPYTSLPKFYLMLTTVIDDDLQLQAVLPPRTSSPTKFTRLRQHDARDHYQQQIVTFPSWFNTVDDPLDPEEPSEPIIVRDDTLKALDLASQYRAAHEMPPLAGSITIPFVTDYYELGDRVKQITGRNVDLRANTAPSQNDGEQPMYPMIVKISYSFSGSQQTTTLHISDLRAEPRG